MEAGEARAKWTGPGECVPSRLARLHQAERRVLVDNGQATGDLLVEHGLWRRVNCLLSPHQTADNRHGSRVQTWGIGVPDGNPKAQTGLRLAQI